MLHKAFQIKSDNLDDVRKGRLLMILVSGTAVAVMLGLALIFLFDYVQPTIGEQDGQQLLLIASIIMLVVIAGVWRLAHYSVTSGAIIFTLVLSIIVLFDEPAQVVTGRSLFLTIIPILIASLTIRPWAGFVVAILNGVLINIIAATYGLGFNIVGVLAFLLIALISGLGASSFEAVLAELQTINKELDLRVIQRTKEAEDARDAAIQASFAKTEMLAKVSHELRTPMGAILGYTEMIRAGVFGEVSNKQTEIHDVIIERLHVLSRMVDLLLNESRLEFGRIKLSCSEFEPKQILSDVQFSIASLAQQKEISIKTEIDADAPLSVFGDREKVEQILLNLATNAIKFTDTGGQVELSVKNGTDDDSWAIHVQDNGRGISPENQESIFQAFHQVHPDEPQEKEGFGLGLSIVRQLLALMGGSIHLESAVDAGSTFIVSFPNQVGKTENEQLNT